MDNRGRISLADKCMNRIMKVVRAINQRLNDFQLNNAALYSILLVVFTAIVTVLVNSVASGLQDEPPAIKGLEKVASMIERLSLDFYGKADEESIQNVTDKVIMYLENEIREKYVTKEEFEKTQNYIKDPETGNITVLRVREGGIYAVSINPDDNKHSESVDGEEDK